MARGERAGRGGEARGPCRRRSRAPRAAARPRAGRPARRAGRGRGSGARSARRPCGAGAPGPWSASRGMPPAWRAPSAGAARLRTAIVRIQPNRARQRTFSPAGSARPPSSSRRSASSPESRRTEGSRSSRSAVAAQLLHAAAAVSRSGCSAARTSGASPGASSGRPGGHPASRTAIVMRTSAHRRSSSSVISTSQTHVVRPLWRRRATAWIVPSTIGRRKLVWLESPWAVRPSSWTANHVRHRGHRLGDRGEDAAVHEAGRLAQLVADRDLARGPPRPTARRSGGRRARRSPAARARAAVACRSRAGTLMGGR